jgi:hypothetical protein
MTIELYLIRSHVYSNQLVCLYHRDHSISLDLVVTTASLWTLRIALCWLSSTVMVPYVWVWIIGPCLFLLTFTHFYGELVERVWIMFFSLPLLSIPVDSVRCGLSSSLVGVCCSLWFHPFDSCHCYDEWIKGSESRVSFHLLALSFLSPLYTRTRLDWSISLVLTVTTALLRTLGMS